MNYYIYTTSKVVMQMRLSGIKGVKIQEFKEKFEYNGIEYRDIAYRYPESAFDEVRDQIRRYKEKERLTDEEYTELKMKRRQMIENYFKDKGEEVYERGSSK